MNYLKLLTKKNILISIISTLNIASLYTTETTPQLKLRSLNKKITPEQLQALKRENFLKIPKLKKQLKLSKDEVKEITQKIRINKEIAILSIIKKILSEDLQNYEPSDSLDVYSTYMANKIIEKYPNIVESIKSDIKKYFLNHFAQKKIFLKIYDPVFIEFIENIIKESLEPNETHNHNDDIFFMTDAYEIISEEQDKYIEPWKIYEQKSKVEKLYLNHNIEPLNELQGHLKVKPKQTVKNNSSFFDGQQLLPEIQQGQKTNQPETFQNKPEKSESILPNINNNKYNSNSTLMYLKPNQSVFKKSSQPASFPSLKK